MEVGNKIITVAVSVSVDNVVPVVKIEIIIQLHYIHTNIHIN